MTQPTLFDAPEPRHVKKGHVRRTSVAVAHSIYSHLATRAALTLGYLEDYTTLHDTAPTVGELAAWVQRLAQGR